MNSSLLSSESVEWYTPENVLDLVRTVGPIGLDPCAPLDKSNPTGARCVYTSEDNGLVRDWRGCGLVYVNSPYGRALPAWTEKIAREAAAGCEIIALLPARTDTRWWQEHVVTAHALCFWRGRLKFRGAPAPAPFPSAIAYFGPRRGRFCDVFSPHGWVTSASYQVRLPL